VLPLSLTILTTAFPAEKRGMIVGVYGGLAGLAVALGPVVGGLVTQAIDWRWIFWLNVPIGIVTALLGVRLLPESYGASERLDLAGVGLITAGALALVWALTRAGDIGWSSGETLITLAAGVALLAAFLAWETRVGEPMVPLRPFALREFAVGNLTTSFMSGAIFAAAFFVTQEFQFARDYSPLGASLRLLPFFATLMFVSPLTGALSDRIGRRPIMASGLTLQAIGFIWVAARGSLHTSWIELTVALLAAGIGISMALPTVPTAVLSAVSRRSWARRPASTTWRSASAPCSQSRSAAPSSPPPATSAHPRASPPASNPPSGPAPASRCSQPSAPPPSHRPAARHRHRPRRRTCRSPPEGDHPRKYDRRTMS
jgi:MFS family permease